MRHLPLALALLLSTAGLASANLKVSLVTVSPGPVVFESFGHTMVMVENPDVSTASATLYEYGAVNPAKVFRNPDPMQAFQDLFDSKVKTNASRFQSPMAQVDEKTRFPIILKYRYIAPRPDSFRTVTIDELSLSDDQAKELVAQLDADMKAGEYNYDNYRNNCATRVRDHLFDDKVLGAGPRLELDYKLDSSIQDEVLGSIDEAIADSPSHMMTLVPPNQERMLGDAIMMLQMMGIPKKFSSSKQFYDALKKGEASMQGLVGADQPIVKSFHNYFFGDELTQKPITTGQAMFLPKKLRETLLNVKNPATGKNVIDPANEIRRSTADELAASKAAQQPPKPAAPQPQSSLQPLPESHHAGMAHI
ncbi:MAG: hypothetical protein HY075_08550 [Deltaproteobacteria bacterium]|nr:hypothetical protein [Deltaproteobacteria bacterium]